MQTAKQVASFFIARANSQGGKVKELSGNNDLTNLKLQKILYFAQVEFLKSHDVALFQENIQAWQYGPVVREVYDWLSQCGGYVITEFDVALEDTSNIASEIIDFLNMIWDKYSRYSAWGLVEKTHEPNSVWNRVYLNGRGNKNTIPISLLREASTL